MTAFHILRIETAQRSPLRAALSDAVIAFGVALFSALSAMSFTSVRLDPAAAVYSAVIPAALLFFVTLKSEAGRSTTLVNPATDPPVSP